MLYRLKVSFEGFFTPTNIMFDKCVVAVGDCLEDSGGKGGVVVSNPFCSSRRRGVLLDPPEGTGERDPEDTQGGSGDNRRLRLAISTAEARTGGSTSSGFLGTSVGANCVK